MKRVAIAAGLLAASAGAARAGGMFLPVTGVRNTSQAGALIAGADDVDALFSNPAGIAHLVGKVGIFVGAMYMNQSVDYARIDSGGVQQPSVSNDYPGIAYPTIGATFGIGDKLVLGVGFTAPYTALHRYEPDGTQRYASVSLAESLAAQVTVGLAYAITPKVRIGATFQDAFTKLDSRITLSGCPGTTVCAPEDPEFDVDTKIEQTDAFVPTGSVGVQVDASKTVTLGAAVQLPSHVGGTGKLTTRLPSSGFYEGASVVGDEASLALDFPTIVRAGVQVKPSERLRLELATDIEFWSTQDEITIKPHDVHIENVAGVGTYDVGPTAIPRHYHTSVAVSVGGEYRVAKHVVLGAGYGYETSAAPAAYVSVLTVDSGKHIIGLGGTFDVAGWQLGATLGFIKLNDVSTTLDEAKVTQQTPVRDQPADIVVNAGQYQSHYVMAGVRVGKAF